jgi:hypothetical protein
MRQAFSIFSHPAAQYHPLLISFVFIPTPEIPLVLPLPKGEAIKFLSPFYVSPFGKRGTKVDFK